MGLTKHAKILMALVAVVMVSIASTGQTARGALIGQLGILDLNANGGVNPATGNAWAVGDTYRLAFVTRGERNATSPNIADYNAFVQNAANNSSLNLSGATWNAIGSTESVNARVNTSTTGAGGEAIFLLDGSSLVATNYGDLWDGVDPSNAIDLDENASFLDAFVFTGTDVNGNSVFDRWLGATNPSKGPAIVVTRGDTTHNAPSRWIRQFNDGPTTTRSFYALSDPLTITAVPEPVSLAIWGLIGLAGGAYRRRRS